MNFSKFPRNIAEIVSGAIVGQNGMRKSVSQTRESQTRESSSSSTSTAIVNINDTTGYGPFINVTSFSNISYSSNSEYWPQISQQNDSIHSIILDVHVLEIRSSKIPFLSVLRRPNKRYHAQYSRPKSLILIY